MILNSIELLDYIKLQLYQTILQSNELEQTVSAMKQQMKKTHGSAADLDKWLRGEQ